MRTFENVLVFLCVAIAHVVAYDVTPKPGALDLYFNTTGTNNLFQTAVPIGAYFGLDGRTFNSTLKDETWFYTFELNSVKIVQASGFTEKILDYEPETNNIHIRIAGINLQTLIDAEFKALNLIPFDSTAVNITNMTVDFKVAAQQEADHVHWHMNETAKVTIGDISIDMENGFLNELVDLNRGLIDLAVNDAVIPYLEGLLTGEVDLVNKMVNGEGEYTFYSGIFGFNNVGMNFTMTSAPQVVGNSDLVKIFFDGLFVPCPTCHPGPIVDFHSNLKSFPPHELHSLSQQFWVNEDTFNSLLELDEGFLFPMRYNSSQVSDALYAAFPTLNNTCSGAPVSVTYELDKAGSPQSQPITFDRIKGVVFGGRDNDVRSTINVFCSGQDESIYTFSSQIQTVANITLHNFMVWPSITSQSFASSILLKGELDPHALYDTQLNSVGAAVQGVFNQEYENGWSLANLNPMLAMAAGLIKNSTVSPFAVDNWLYAGFEMQADLPNEEPVLEFIE